MAENKNLDTLDRVVDSSGKVAVLVGAIVFVVKVVIPLFTAIIETI